MTPSAVITLLEELRVLRAAAAQVQEYQPGKVRVTVEFHPLPGDHRVTVALNQTALDEFRAVVTTDEMRTRMTARLAARIAAIEAKLPAGVVDGG